LDFDYSSLVGVKRNKSELDIVGFIADSTTLQIAYILPEKQLSEITK